MFDKTLKIHLRMMKTFTQTQRQKKIHKKHTFLQLFCTEFTSDKENLNFFIQFS